MTARQGVSAVTPDQAVKKKHVLAIAHQLLDRERSEEVRGKRRASEAPSRERREEVAKRMKRANSSVLPLL